MDGWRPRPVTNKKTACPALVFAGQAVSFINNRL